MNIVEAKEIVPVGNGKAEYPNGDRKITLDLETIVSMNCWGFPAEIIDEKWTYTKTETTTSTSASLSGWTQTGSFWQQTTTGTWYYGSYPSGFNTGNSLYSKYNKSALTAYTNDTTKREVSAASFYTYIYWHWHYDCGSVTANDRLISAQKGTGSNGMYYGLFAAFESSTNYGHTDSNGTTCSEYFCHNCESFRA